MNFFKQNTSNLFRVFFVIFIIALAGIGLQENKKITTEIKSIGGSLTEGIVGAPRFINPVLAQLPTDIDITRLVFTPLLTVKADGDINYNLVSNLEKSKDGLVYTAHLLPDVTFEDGTLLDADDVIFTIESIKDPMIKSPLDQKWQGVEVEKLDQYTLTFTLVRPFSDFIYNLELGILPRHIWKDIEPQEFIYSTYNTSPVGNGPFVVTNITTQETGVPAEYHFTRSTHSRESSYIKNLSIHFFDNESDLVKALNNGDVDSAYGISSQYASSIKNKYAVYSAPLPRVFALFFNQAKQPILQSKKIRQAITYSINKENLVDTIFDGYAFPIDSVFGTPTETSQYNPEIAQKIIESEGWKKNNVGIYTKTIDGKVTELKFDISIPNVEDIRKAADEIKDDLSKTGIIVTIRSFDIGNFKQSILRPRDYESIIFGYEIERPSDIYDYWHSSRINDPGLNVSLFKDDAVDTALQNMRSEASSSLSEIDSQITKNYPAVFLYTPSYIYFISKKVHEADIMIKKSSDRFNTIDDWYITTRHVWPFFIDDNEKSHE